MSILLKLGYMPVSMAPANRTSASCTMSWRVARSTSRGKLPSWTRRTVRTEDGTSSTKSKIPSWGLRAIGHMASIRRSSRAGRTRERDDRPASSRSPIDASSSIQRMRRFAAQGTRARTSWASLCENCATIWLGGTSLPWSLRISSDGHWRRRNSRSSAPRFEFCRSSSRRLARGIGGRGEGEPGALRRFICQAERRARFGAAARMGAAASRVRLTKRPSTSG